MTIDRTMRIGIVCYPTFGGSGVLATELGKALAQKGHMVHFITYQQPVRLGAFTPNIFYHEVQVPTYPLFDYPPYETALASSMVDVIKNNDLDLIVFYYPRNWQQGEIIWTPLKEKTDAVQKKYRSASKVYSCPLDELQEDLHSQEICMIFLLIDVPQDRLMAYQHTKQNNFFTHKGVDKDFGAHKIAEHLQFELRQSIGAGDYVMDSCVL